MDDLIQENARILDSHAPPPRQPTFSEPSSFSEPQTFSAVGDDFLVFTLGAETFAVSVANVVEAAAAASLAVTILPNAPEWLCGLLNLRGAIVPVINLPVLLQKPAADAHAPKAKYVVLRSQFFEFGAAFKTDRINEIVCIPNAEIAFTTPANSSPLIGQTTYQTQNLTLIDSEKLFSTLPIG